MGSASGQWRSAVPDTQYPIPCTRNSNRILCVSAPPKSAFELNFCQFRENPDICDPLTKRGPKTNRDMPTRIRLQRKGKKGKPYYHLVVADQRAPRDGKYIERIGAYDPNRNPALVEVDREKAMDWLQKGAQPSDTARAILSYTGVVFKNHLQNGVKKGAFDQAEADRRFDGWMSEKAQKVEAKRTGLVDGAEKAFKDRVEAERKKSEDRAATLIAKMNAQIAAPAVEAEATGEAPAVEADAPIAEAEAPAATEGEAPAEA